MTRSKIFTGAAALVLTSAAAIATANSNHRQTVYYQTAGLGFNPVTLVGVCPVGGATCVQTVVIRGVSTVKQLYFTPSLSEPLQRQSF